MKIGIFAMLLALALTGCEEAAKDKVLDIWQPGHYNPALCVDDTNWLIAIQRPDGSKGARCVPSNVGKKQRIGKNFVPA